MTEFRGAVMQHLRQILSITFLVSLLGGCSVNRHAPGPCPSPINRFDVLPPPPPDLEPTATSESPADTSTYVYRPVVYQLDKHRSLEIFDTGGPGHFTFLQNGKRIRTEPILYCSAAPMFLNGDLVPPPNSISPAIHLTGSKSNFVVVCQQGDDHYLYSVFKLAPGFPKAGQFKWKTPLDLVKIGPSYRFSGELCLPSAGALQRSSSVLFKFEKGRLKLDRESMRKKLPTEF